MNFLKKAYGFVKSPAKSFKPVKKEALGEAFKYMALMTLLIFFLTPAYFSITAFVKGAFLWSDLLNPLLVILMLLFYLYSIIGLTFLSLWLHVWAYVLGAKKGLVQTMKATFYGATPYYLLGWIPPVWIISLFWTLILQWLGLMKLQEINPGKAMIAILIPWLIMIYIYLTYGMFA